MRWLLCVILAVCWAPVAAADRQFWAVVGSYREFVYAEEALAHANAALRESFDMSSVDIASDRWYRVMTGPYISREAAESVIVGAQQAGFDSAWILVTEHAEIEAQADYAEYSNYSMDISSPDDDYPNIESLLPPSTSTEQRNVHEARFSHEVVDQAPEGYGLHKLRRGGE